jgi:hypothetical protein
LQRACADSSRLVSCPSLQVSVGLFLSVVVRVCVLRLQECIRPSCRGFGPRAGWVGPGLLLVPRWLVCWAFCRCFCRFFCWSIYVCSGLCRVFYRPLSICIGIAVPRASCHCERCFRRSPHAVHRAYMRLPRFPRSSHCTLRSPCRRTCIYLLHTVRSAYLRSSRSQRRCCCAPRDAGNPGVLSVLSVYFFFFQMEFVESSLRVAFAG